MAIPVVDFNAFKAGLPEDSLSEDLPIVRELHSAFTTVGFVFITNHGIDRKLVEQTFEAGEKFFSLPEETKKMYCRAGNDNNGYVCMEMEGLDPSRPSDLKECFNITDQHTAKIPDVGILPFFKPAVTELYQCMMRLALRLLELMGHGLKLKDPRLFAKSHQSMGHGADHNFTTMRLLHYPPLPPSKEVKPGQLRCGEHVDYGSITLLFQDPNGGLQVKSNDGGYIDVPYMQDAVLVNLGALMQNWTADVYLATPHRVLLPTEVTNKTRQSLAFFVHPDNEVLVECVDGSNKYPTITAAQDTIRRLNQTY